MRDAARQLFAVALALREAAGLDSDAIAAHSGLNQLVYGGSSSCDGSAKKSPQVGADDAIVRAYLAFLADESETTLGVMFRAGQEFTSRADQYLCTSVTGADQGDGDQLALNLPFQAGEADHPEVADGLRLWQREWRLFRRLWLAWRSTLTSITQRPAPPPPPPVSLRAEICPTTLTQAQQAGIEQLAALWQARQGETGRLVPTSILRRWSHPLLVGPAASGKAYVCEEVSRRLGLSGWMRCDLGGWIIVANRSTRGTLDRIEHFLANHPGGMIYLSGLDAITSSRLQAGDGNASWWTSVVAEIEAFLDWAGERADENQVAVPKPFIVVGGRFAMLWGETDLIAEAGADAWRNGDDEALGSTKAVVQWLRTQAGLPSSVLRRLAVARPVVITRPDAAEAERLAHVVCAALPPALDGAVDVAEVASILTEAQGWQGLANMIEGALAESVTPG